MAEWPICFFSVLPVGQCRSICDKLLTQPLPKNRHSLAAWGAPLPIPDQRGQADLSYSGWSVCHVRKWVLSLALCRNTFVQEHFIRKVLIVPSYFFCGWDQHEQVLVLFSILTAFDCILPHPRSLSLCRDVSFRSEVACLLSLLAQFSAIAGECALNCHIWICLSGWDGRTHA